MPGRDPSTMTPEERGRELLRMAVERFDGLTPAEEEMFKATGEGRTANFERDWKAGLNDPRNLTRPAYTSAQDCRDRLLAEVSRFDKQWAALCQYRDSLRRKPKGHRLSADVIGSRLQRIERVMHRLCLRATRGVPTDDLVRIRADRLRWLVLTPAARLLSDNRGVGVSDAVIDGELILNSADVSRSLRLRNCFFTAGLSVRNTKFRELLLSGSMIFGSDSNPNAAVFADGATFQGHLFLRNRFTALGEVRIPGICVNGQLDCSGAQFRNAGRVAISAFGSTIAGSVLLRQGFAAQGEVQLTGGWIGGQLDCSGGRLRNSAGFALTADGLTVKGDVFLRDRFTSLGEVRLLGASIGGQLVCHGGRFRNPSGFAIAAMDSRVGGGVLFGVDNDARSLCTGVVSFARARLGSRFAVRGARFGAERSARTVGMGALDLTDSEVLGSVWIGSWADPQKPGSSPVHPVIRGTLVLSRARIRGKLDLAGLEIRPGTGHAAVEADAVRVGGSVFLNRYAMNHAPIRPHGPVHFTGARVGQDVYLCEGLFSNGVGDPLSPAVSFSRAVVHGLLQVDGCRHRATADAAADPSELLGLADAQEACRFEGALDLTHARAGVLRDDFTASDRGKRRTEPQRGKCLVDDLRLDGFVFDALDPSCDRSAAARLALLERMRPEYFSVQPYEHVARLLDQAGQDEDAKEILIEEARLDFAGSKSWWRRRGGDIFGALLGYGHRKFKPLWYLAYLVVVGWIVFGLSNRYALLGPVGEDVLVSSAWTERAKVAEPTPDQQRSLGLPPGFPSLSPLVYSLDLALPIIDLRQEAYWIPDPARGRLIWRDTWYGDFTTGRLLRWYMWLHILLGWTFTTFFIVGLTGLVKGGKAENVAG